MNVLLTDKQMSNQVGVEHQPLDIKGFFYNENSNVIVVDFLFGEGEVPQFAS